MLATSITLGHTFAAPALPPTHRAPSLGRALKPIHPSLRVRGGAAPPLEAGVDGELVKSVFRTAANKAFAGGATGSVAGVAQVITFMWLRTAMNYQYRHGGSLRATLKYLWDDGGIPRFYRGLPFAIFQGPLSRFGSAASNTLVLGLRDADAFGLGSYPVYVVTVLGSALTALYRCLLMPIDTLKTVSQVDGRRGFDAVARHAFRRGNVRVLYTGAAAMALATFVGHYPWFATFNVLNRVYPKKESALYNSARLALIGFVASVVSDVSSNPIRVVKTTKQSAAAKTALKCEDRRNRQTTDEDSYLNIVLNIAKQDGVQAFFTRGLSTRILANGLQSIVFTVIWRLLLD